MTAGPALRCGAVVSLGSIARIVTGAMPRYRGGARQAYRYLASRDADHFLPPANSLDLVEVGADTALPHALEPGDIVVATRSGRVRAAVAAEDHAGVLLGAALIAIVPQDRALAHGLAAYLRREATSEALLRRTAGTAHPNVGVKDLSNLDVRLPEPRLRDAFEELAALATEIDRLSRAANALRLKEIEAISARLFEVGDEGA